MTVKLLAKKAGTGKVAQQHKQQGAVIAESDHAEEVGEPRTLEGPTCSVGVEASMTKNLGNYESLRLQVALQVPCYHGEIDKVFDFAQGWVNAKMETLLAELEGDQAA